MPATAQSLRGAVFGFCLALLLPAWLGTGFFAWRMAEAEREAITREGRDLAGAVAASAEREIRTLRGALMVLAATAATPAAPDMATLESQLDAPFEALGAMLGFGLRLDTTLAPPPSAGGEGGVVPQLGTGALHFPLSLPLPGGGSAPALWVEASGLWPAILHRITLPAGWGIAIQDAEGRLLARRPMEPPRLRAAPSPGASPSPMVDTTTAARVVVATRRLPEQGWTVMAAAPRDKAEGLLTRRLLPILLAGGVLVLLVPALAAGWAARRIGGPLARIAAQAAALGRDAPHSPVVPSAMGTAEPMAPLAPVPPSGLREVDAVADALAAALAARRLRELAVSASDALRQDVLDHLPVGLVLAEAPQGRIVFVNARLAAIAGRPVSLDDSIAHYAEDWEAWTAEGKRLAASDLPLARALASGRAANADYRLRRGDGRLIWIRAMAMPMMDAAGAIRGAVSVLVEVGDEYAAARALGEQVEAEATARREAMATAAALAASEERFRRFAEASPDALFIQDPAQPRPVYVGPAAARLSGLPSERLRDDPEAWPAEVLAEDRERFRAALAQAAAGATAEAEYRLRRPDGSVVWIHDIAFPIAGRPGGTPPDAAPRLIGRLARDTSAAKQAEARQALLIAELNHRVKNTLTTVLSLAQQTARGQAGQAPDVAGLDGFLAVFRARLQALAGGHDLLTASTWRGAALDELAETVLAPWRGPSPRIHLDGPPIWLGPRQALALALALHELATNAAKHGALSPGSAGHANLVWFANPAGGSMMRWQEVGGPEVSPPAREGFGARLLGRGLAAELGPGASVTLDYLPDGLVARIAFPDDRGGEAP